MVGKITIYSRRNVKMFWSSDDSTRICLELGDSSLVRSLRSPPLSHSGERGEWLHELVHLRSIVSTVTMRSYDPTSVFLQVDILNSEHASCTCKYTNTGISCNNLRQEINTLCSYLYLQSACLPLGILRGTW